MQTDKTGELDALISDEIIEAICNAQYHLLVGAGISFGESNKKGVKLPSGSDLLKDIRKDFTIDDDEMGLQQTFDVVSEENIHKKEAIRDYLKDRFSGCSHSWQKIIFDFNWSIIWSLNIDDVLENSVRDNINLRSYTWSDAYNTSKNSRQIIHMHGYVHHLPDSDFVFSTTEYANTVENQGTWHKIFSDTFPHEPYIIVGASMSNEFDLSSAISKLNVRVGSPLPTIIVSPGLNKYVERTLISKGILVIKCTGEEFFRYLYSRYESIVTKNIDDKREFDFLFSQQFDKVPSSHKIINGHDFYAGHEPTMNDILKSYDARLHLTDLTLKKILEDFTEDRQQGSLVRLYIIDENPGSGKTTALLRILKELSDKGISSYHFREPQEIDTASVIGFSKSKI